MQVGLAAGFFFSGRRNQVAAIRIALAWKDLLESPLGILPQAPPPAGKRGCFFGAAVSAAAQRPRRASRLHRGQKTSSQKRLDPPPKQRMRRTATGGRAKRGRASWRPFPLPIRRGSDQAAPPVRELGLEPLTMLSPRADGRPSFWERPGHALPDR